MPNLQMMITTKQDEKVKARLVASKREQVAIMTNMGKSPRQNHKFVILLVILALLVPWESHVGIMHLKPPLILTGEIPDPEPPPLGE